MSLATAKRVLRIESEAIAGLIARLDERFEKAVELLYACKGRVVVTGLGKSGLIGRKIAATFASIGTPSLFLHASEALHGDLGMLTGDDVLLAISSSGETEELIELVESVKRLGIHLITLTANPRSTLGSASNIVLDIAVKEEACSLNLGADSFHRRGHGYGRRARDFVARAARLQRRRLRGIASRRTSRQEIAPRRIVDARWRSSAARPAHSKNAGRDLRDEPQGTGSRRGDRSRWQAAGHHHRWRLAPRDAKTSGKCCWTSPPPIA